jgi:hypothetical protein
MFSCRSLVLAVLLVLSQQINTSVAEFGVLKEKPVDASVDEAGNIQIEGENPYADMATRLQSFAPIDIQDAVDIAALLHAAQLDADTNLMISTMKNDQAETLAALAKEVTAMEIVQEMKKSLDEWKAMEVLFQDPQRAFTEMEREGLIDKSRLDFYKANPEALVDETRKGIYFGFVSMAVAGGFLE